MKDWLPFWLSVLLIVGMVIGMILFSQSLEVGTWEYNHIAGLAKEFPEIRKDIDEFMEDGYISLYELSCIEHEAHKAAFNRARQSVTKE